MISLVTTMSARDAARRMGVKVETLYAYVSRGLLTRAVGVDGRSSVFDSREIEELARRGRPRRSSRSTSLDLLIETRLTELSARGPRYRGHEATELATTHTFEQVAELLWCGALPVRYEPWSGGSVQVERGLDLADSMAVAVASIGARHAAQTARPGLATATDDVTIPLDAAVDRGRALIAGVVGSLPGAGALRVPRLTLADGPPLGRTIAGRLWTRVSPRRPGPGMLAVLNAALVLLADHDLATSTFAVRVAASTRAGPEAAVSAGLGALRGPLHGGASRGAQAVLERAAAAGARTAVDEVLRAGRHVPGFGHPVYAAGDPRAAVLFGMLGGVCPPRVDRVCREVIAAVHERVGEAPNVDLALAAFAWANDLPRGAAEVTMATARMAGWIAHAIEEYGEVALRFRPRASYVG